MQPLDNKLPDNSISSTLLPSSRNRCELIAERNQLQRVSKLPASNRELRISA